MPSINNSWSLFDLFNRRSGREGIQDNYGFIFTETSGQTKSGENVNVENALVDATVVSCINAIVQGITQIPIYVHKERADGKGSDRIVKHPIERLLRRPNAYETPTEFKSSIVTSILVHGNCFIRIVRDGRGNAIQLYPMDPIDITIGSNQFGLPVYTHETYGDIPMEDIVHIRDITTHAPQGLSRTILAAEIIGAKRAADSLMAETFRNGISLNYVVSSNGAVDAAKLQNLTEQMKNAFGQGGSRRGGVAFIEDGDVSAIKGATPADVDMRELREALIKEIAAVYKVPAFLAGASGDQKYNNVRQFWAAFHRDTLNPIANNIAEALSLKLLPDDEFVHFDTMEILAGDVEIQSRVAQGNVSQGIWTPNEAREVLGYTPSEEEHADQLVQPNSSINTNIESGDNPSDATGGEDGPQGADNG